MKAASLISEDERPLYHFTARTGWLNDPNGFSYHGGWYHLFYQYHPYSSYWGPMHWGHAVSKDLVRWEYLPAVLAPDEAYDNAGCFSGSAITLPDGRHLLMYTGCNADDTDPDGKWAQTQCLAVSSVIDDRSGLKDSEKNQNNLSNSNNNQSSDDYLKKHIQTAGCNEEYIKYEKNPVITECDLPTGGDKYEFRDPYIWRASDGSYRAIIANARKNDAEGANPESANARGGTQLSLFRSDDAFNWEFDKVLFEDDSKLGIMWECPNFFPLEDAIRNELHADANNSSGADADNNGGAHKHYVLIASPMDMELEDADGSIRFPKGNNVCYMVGDYDEVVEVFTPRHSAAHEKAHRDAVANYHPVDCGLDFYAPQVMKAPDGRTIMIGWMQDPSTANLHDDDFKFFGQMSTPRELCLRGGRLIQTPIRELENYRSGKPVFAGIELGSNESAIEGISGRTIDMQIEISPKSDSAPGSCSFESFTMRFARDYEHYVELSYRPDSSVLTIDRSRSGQAEEITKSRSIRVRDRDGTIALRVLLDKYSAEIFINGGEQVMSATYYTPLEADDITFSAEGEAILDISAYTLDEQH